MEDVERVRRSQSGDRGAFEELIRATARLLWAVVYGQVHDPAWTEDIVQETYLKAWASIAELKNPTSFRAWLLTIARRLSWRHAELAARPLPPPEAPSTPADADDARDQVREALTGLPERYRLPVTLHLLNGMDYAAISRELGLENGTLRGLIARGTKKLRAALTPWWRTRDEHA